MPFMSPGAGFTSAFENSLAESEKQKHQALLDDLAAKREQRMAQAELDSHAQFQDELARKKAKDLSDAHDKKVGDFEKHIKETYVKGDRAMPEDIQTAKDLNLFPFRQGAPAMSAPEMTPPAALMEAPPAGASPEGSSFTAAPEEAVPSAANMTPGALEFPGTATERGKEADRARHQALIDTLYLTKKQSAVASLVADGVPVPAGFMTADKTDVPILKQNTRTGKIEQRDPKDGVFKPLVGDAPPNAHWMTEPTPKDTTASDTARENHLQTAKEKAYTRIDKEIGKSQLETMLASDQLLTALSQKNEVGDAVVAPLVLKATVTAGGNSGFRMTKPEIDRVLTMPAGRSLMLKLNSWTGNGPLQIDATERKILNEMGMTIYKRASDNYSKILDAEDRITEHKDVNEINREVLKLKRGIVGDLTEHHAGLTPPPGPPAVTGDIEYDASGMMIKPGTK
jgi:hypothetical protein